MEDNGKLTWWKTYDYKSGRSYILGEQFVSKAEALKYAEEWGMVVIGRSTRRVTDEEREQAL